MVWDEEGVPERGLWFGRRTGCAKFVEWQASLLGDELRGGSGEEQASLSRTRYKLSRWSQAAFLLQGAQSLMPFHSSHVARSMKFQTLRQN